MSKRAIRVFSREFKLKIVRRMLAGRTSGEIGDRPRFCERRFSAQRDAVNVVCPLFPRARAEPLFPWRRRALQPPPLWGPQGGRGHNIWRRDRGDIEPRAL